MALDTIGTVKLRKMIEDTYNDDGSNDFDKFFCVFTLCDLRLPKIQLLLNTYVKQIKENALLKTIFFKLLYYYQFRYFGTDLDQFLLDTLAEIKVKINHKSRLYKQHYINQLKDSCCKNPDSNLTMRDIFNKYRALFLNQLLDCAL